MSLPPLPRLYSTGAPGCTAAFPPGTGWEDTRGLSLSPQMHEQRLPCHRAAGAPSSRRQQGCGGSPWRAIERWPQRGWCPHHPPTATRCRHACFETTHLIRSHRATRSPECQLCKRFPNSPKPYQLLQATAEGREHKKCPDSNLLLAFQVFLLRTSLYCCETLKFNTITPGLPCGCWWRGSLFTAMSHLKNPS